MRKNSVLVLAAHTDDGELGCGGTLARFVEEGRDVYYTAFSTAGAPEPYTPDVVKAEVKEAVQQLGIRTQNLFLFDYKIRELCFARQRILDDMLKLRREFDPEVVLFPCRHDVHQDHKVIHDEALRAFKHCTLLGYELTWNNMSFNSSHYVRLDTRHVQKKMDALNCYASQKHRHYVDGEFIWGLARTRGVQIAQKYAEAFDLVRWVLT